MTIGTSEPVSPRSHCDISPGEKGVMAMGDCEARESSDGKAMDTEDAGELEQKINYKVVSTPPLPSAAEYRIAPASSGEKFSTPASSREKFFGQMSSKCGHR